MERDIGGDQMEVEEQMRWWKPEVGNAYRISMGWWKEKKDDGRPDLVKNGECTSPQFLGWRGDNPSESTATTVVVVWPNSENEDVDWESVSCVDVVVSPWLLSMGEFETLKAVHAEFPFCEHDIIMKRCEGGLCVATYTPTSCSYLERVLQEPQAQQIATGILDKIAGATKAIMALTEDQ